MIKKAGRYQTQDLVEGQYEPGSKNRVLKNLLHIKTTKQMDLVENNGLLDALDKCVRIFGAKHKFTAKDICHIHEIWLGGIYQWAGKYRNVNLAKSEFSFAAARYIPQLMAEFERRILKKYTPCNYQDREGLVEALAVVHVELILIHPFREGNGRMARLLANLMSMQSGLPPLDFKKMSKNRETYFKAIQVGMSGNYEPMKKIFAEIIEDTMKLVSS